MLLRLESLKELFVFPDLICGLKCMQDICSIQCSVEFMLFLNKYLNINRNKFFDKFFSFAKFAKRFLFNCS